MGSKSRAEGAKLRVRYAKQFQLPLEEVELEEVEGDDAKVYAPKRPDLPVWRTGTM